MTALTRTTTRTTHAHEEATVDAEGPLEPLRSLPGATGARPHPGATGSHLHQGATPVRVLVGGTTTREARRPSHASGTTLVLEAHHREEEGMIRAAVPRLPRVDDTIPAVHRLARAEGTTHRLAPRLPLGAGNTAARVPAPHLPGEAHP